MNAAIRWIARSICPAIALLACSPTIAEDVVRYPLAVVMDTQSPQRAHDITLTRVAPESDGSDGSEIAIESNGQDPFLFIQLPSLPTSDRDWMLSMRTFGTRGVRGVQLYLGFPSRVDNRFDLPPIPPSEGWTNYTVNLSDLLGQRWRSDTPTWIRLDLGHRSDMILRMRELTLRQQTDAELAAIANAAAVRDAKKRLDDRLVAYAATEMPASIDRIDHLADRIEITGRWSDATLLPDPSGIAVIARLAHERSMDPIPAGSTLAGPGTRLWRELTWMTTDDGQPGRFELEIDAGADSPYRAPGVRWQVVRVNGPLTSKEPSDAVGAGQGGAKSGQSILAVSAARYPDGLWQSRVAKQLPAPEPLHAAKGLTCLDGRFTSDQLRDLGLRHGSVNILMNGLIRRQPGDDYQPITIRGRELFYHVGRATALDRNVRMLRNAGLTVAGILLIAPSRENPEDALGWNDLVHPDFDPDGSYSMPNLVDADAAELYGLTCDFLAQRYAGNDDRHGRIDHWIVHNEVDAGWQWTNMGEQPMHAFLDHYFRSLRMVDAATRTHNPHAVTFISLTHFWNRDGQPWRWYAPQKIMDALLRHGEIEGDFPWGLAFHPYPQSLWKADTWNDDEVTDSLDTPMITIKNIHVLDRFMHTDRVRRSDGGVRPVILSEQGFHAPEDDDEKLAIQSAALLYTFQQIRACPSILAFDYHRPVDHPNEGGLRLGLRGLPSTDHRIGRAKPAWDVYRAIDTAAESELLTKYRSVWEPATAEDGSIESE